MKWEIKAIAVTLFVLKTHRCNKRVRAFYIVIKEIRPSYSIVHLHPIPSINRNHDNPNKSQKEGLDHNLSLRSRNRN